MLISGDFQVVSLKIVGTGVSVGFRPVRWSRLNRLWATDPSFNDPGYDGSADGKIRLTVRNPEILSKLSVGTVHRFGLGPEMRPD